MGDCVIAAKGLIMFTDKFDAPCCITGQTALCAAFGSDRLYPTNVSEVAFKGVVTLEPDVPFTGSCVIGDGTNAVPIPAPEATHGGIWSSQRYRNTSLRRGPSIPPASAYICTTVATLAQQQSAPESALPPRQPRGEGSQLSRSEPRAPREVYPD